MVTVARKQPQRGLKMGDIDEISEALGSIKSSISNLADGHKSISEKLVIIDNKLSQHSTDRILDKSQLDAAHKRLDRIEPMVDSHSDKFKFVAWLIAGITSIITLFMNWVGPMFSGIFK